MLYFDDVFYNEYSNTGKVIYLKDRNEQEIPVTVHEEEGSISFIYRNGEVEISYRPYDVAWRKCELSGDTKHYVAEEFVAVAKKKALELDIKNQLLEHIVPLRRYFDYYKSEDSVFTVYAIANYDVRQENKSSILVRFEPRHDRMAEATVHKLQGIIPSSEGNSRVVSTSVEAWRYKKLDWQDVREICPEFVTEVLQGKYP